VTSAPASSPGTPAPVAPADVEAAARRIARHVRSTPVLELRAGELPGLAHDVVLKLELLQHTGSFKARGAFHRVLTEHVPAAGVTAASGGNHGAALAYAASTLGHRAEIFVPETSPPMKAARIAALGAHVVLGGARYDDAQAACDAHAAVTGALVVHPFDHPATVAGAGTCARELEAQVGQVDTVLTSTGGGGLTAGTASWFAGRARVVSVEPATSRSMAAALEAGRPVEVEVEGLAIDSLGTRMAGGVTFACCAAYGVVPVTVSDTAIRDAQRVLWRALRLVVEPGGAAALAGLLSGAYQPAPDERVAVVVCGANCDPATVVD
jgi:threonine dehydratase